MTITDHTTDTDDDDSLEDLTDPTAIQRVRQERNQYRKDAKRVPKLETELAEAKKELAVVKSGLDLGDTPEKVAARTAALLAAHGDKEMTPEALKATAITLGFAEDKEPETEEALDAQERVAQAQATGGPAKAGELTPADVAEWPVDKWSRFAKEHPDKAEALLRGEPVNVPNA